MKRKELTMDIKAKIEEIVKKIKDDPGFMKTFQDNPEKPLSPQQGSTSRTACWIRW